MAPDRRRAPRRQLTLDATFRARGRACPVHLSEISRMGCRAEIGASPASAGERIILKLSEHVTLNATVKWARIGQAGLSFSNPLHGAVLIEFAKDANRKRPH